MPTRRLQTIEKLAQAGIPVLVSAAPVIPFITEQKLEKVMQRLAEALKRYGLNKSGRYVQLGCSQFRKPLSIPPAAKTGTGQLDIFG